MTKILAALLTGFTALATAASAAVPIARNGRWKLIVEESPPLLELYDLESDPGETTNLACDPANPSARTSDAIHLAAINDLLQRTVLWLSDCRGASTDL
jgi:hypothetical protein